MKQSLALSAALLAATVVAVPAALTATSAWAADDTAADSGQPVTDGWITTKVKAELATTDGVKSMDISVETSNGVVTLTGVLANEIAVKKAVAAAESIKGVKKVDASGLKAKS